jgi:hypothetical protein
MEHDRVVFTLASFPWHSVCHVGEQLAAEAAVIWPDAVQHGRRDPWSKEERALLDTHAKTIEWLTGRPGSTLALQRADGSWFLVIDWGARVPGPKEFKREP